MLFGLCFRVFLKFWWVRLRLLCWMLVWFCSRLLLGFGWVCIRWIDVFELVLELVVVKCFGWCFGVGGVKSWVLLFGRFFVVVDGVEGVKIGGWLMGMVGIGWVVGVMLVGMGLLGGIIELLLRLFI